MFGKLLKYEWKSGAWMFPLSLLAIVAVFGVGMLFKALGFDQGFGTTIVVLVILGIAVLVMSMVYTVRRYAQGLFGAEGYLMQTLPVRKRMLVGSKTIFAVAMLIIGYLALFLSLFLVLVMVDPGEMFMKMFGDMGINVLLVAAIISLPQQLLFVAEVYLAITLANTHAFSSHPLMFGIILFIGLTCITSTVDMLAMLFIPIGLQISGEGFSLVLESTFTSLGSAAFGTTTDVNALSGLTLGLGSIITDIIMSVVALMLCGTMLRRYTSVK